MTSSESQQNGSSVSNSFLDNCKLYVENISPAVTQEMFSSHIKQFFAEKCVSCEIIKEQNKMDSCVGFITMDSHESADEVIKQLNGSELCDKKLRFTWDIKDAKARNANDSNLYVKSIRKDLSIKGFDDAFRTYGSLLSTKLSTNEKGESNGYGYVRYVNSSDAKKVLEDKSVQEELKKQIGDENFVIEKYQKQKQSPYNTNIYIDNIDKDCDEKKFLEVIHSYGQILQAHQNMFAFKYDEEHECYKAFVNFSNADDAKKAIDDLNGSNKFGKNVIRATFFKNKLQRKKDFDIKKSKINTEYSNSNLRITTNVFPITEDIIHEKFDSCGEIYSISVIFVDKKPTESAYVCFTTKEAALAAINKSNELGWTAEFFKSSQDSYLQYPNLPPYGFMTPNMPQFSPVYQQFPFPMAQPFPFQQQFVHLPFPFQQQPYRAPNKSRKTGSGKSTKSAEVGQKKASHKEVEQKKEEQKKVEQTNVTEEMLELLGNDLYEYVENNFKFDEDANAKITGVLLESFEYGKLKDYLDNKKEKLNKTIKDIKNGIKDQE